MSRKDYSSIEVGGDEASGYANRPSDKKVQQLKDHVSEVSNIMQENINKILERGQRLEHLEDRSEILSSRADDFRVSAKRVSRKMWWQNMRVNIIIGVVIVAIVIIIIVSVKSS